MKKLKVAMVGLGNFGGYRRERMRETGLFEIVAAYDLNPKAMEQCQKQDGAKPVASYDELLKTPGIEAMVISTGAKFHAEQALAAMEKGLHVFVEKPLCSTPKEVSALLKMQSKTGLVVGVGHIDHQHCAKSLTIKKMISDGKLGKIAAFEKTTAHSGGLWIKPGDWRGDPKKNPGGMLFQCGCHGLHELIFYFGPIKSVKCSMRYDVHTTQTADVALCLLEFESGLVGNLNAYHVSPYRHTMNLFGTKANIYVNERFFDEGTLLHMQVEHMDGKKQPMQPVKITGKDDICGNLRSFYKAVRNGGTPYPSLIDGARAVLAVFAAEDAAKSGKTVRVQ